VEGVGLEGLVVPRNPYYAEELEYLRELGREFAHENPTLAPALAQRGSDPDVDRVLEGAAFLTGLIRARLDDDLPELTQTLLEMLWPHYLRPIPSLCIAEFSHPAKPRVGQTQQLARGATELESVAVDGTPCRFQTCYDLAFHPLRIAEVRLESGGRGALRVRLELLGGAKPEELRLDPLRLYCHGALPAASLLHLWLVRRTRAVELEVPQAGRRVRRHALPEHPAPVRAVGFAEHEGLFPYPRQSFLGYRLLQEYFALPQKFLFADVCGIPDLKSLGVERSFDLVFQFRERPPESLRVEAEHLRLHCTPAVNLRAMSADPIQLTPERRSYLLRPSAPEPGHYEVHSVDRVVGLLHGRPERREYDEFFSFRHGLRVAGESLYYKVARRPARGRPNSDAFVSFVSADEKAALPEAETVSIDLTCTNRTLCEGLRPGDLRVHSDRSPQYAEFRNLTPPTRSVLPPLEGSLHWGLISHLALGFSSLASVEGLAGALRLYCFHAQHDELARRALHNRLQGIRAFDALRAERMFGGAPVRGVHSTLVLDEQSFASEGELVLFASVLDEFLALYVSLNSFSQLTVRGASQGEVYEWNPRLGRQIIL
jgi:type VI secretion system protein ImpG